MKIVFATRNQGKVNEVRWLFQGSGWEVLTLADVAPGVVIKEEGANFAENAREKARAVFAQTGMWTMGEDSGLEIDALGGSPGVLSARFGGEGLTDLERNQRILELMIAVPDERRTARFRCVVCVVNPVGEERFFEGVCEGKIALTIRGFSGFGYDPLFIPDGYGQTFAELGVEIKNKISHRAKALGQVLKYLKSITDKEHSQDKKWCGPGLSVL